MGIQCSPITSLPQTVKRFSAWRAEGSAAAHVPGGLGPLWTGGTHALAQVPAAALAWAFLPALKVELWGEDVLASATLWKHIEYVSMPKMENDDYLGFYRKIKV